MQRGQSVTFAKRYWSERLQSFESWIRQLKGKMVWTIQWSGERIAEVQSSHEDKHGVYHLVIVESANGETFEDAVYDEDIVKSD